MGSALTCWLGVLETYYGIAQLHMRPFRYQIYRESAKVLQGRGIVQLTPRLFVQIFAAQCSMFGKYCVVLPTSFAATSAAFDLATLSSQLK